MIFMILLSSNNNPCNNYNSRLAYPQRINNNINNNRKLLPKNWVL
jgi:hypothetical protein